MNREFEDPKDPVKSSGKKDDTMSSTKLKTDESDNGGGGGSSSNNKQCQKIIEQLIQEANHIGKQDVLSYFSIGKADKLVAYTEFAKTVNFIDKSINKDDSYKLYMQIKDKNDKVSLK